MATKAEPPSFTPMSKEALAAIKKGDVVERMLAFRIPCLLVVQSVTEDIIDCGWKFDRNTGIEIDKYIPVKVSYLRKVLSEEERKSVSLDKVLYDEKGDLREGYN